jgi:hypothetical protein
MPRGAEKAAIDLAHTTNNDASGMMNNANENYNPLHTFFTNELNNPQGFSPQDLSSMTTASNQTLGGSNAGAVGGLATLAARTGNAAGLATAQDQSARNNAKIASGNALDIQGKNAELKQKQQQSGAQGLSSLYGENLTDSLKSLGLSDEAINTWLKGANETSGDISKITAEIAGGLSGGAGGVAAAANGGTNPASFGGGTSPSASSASSAFGF